MKNLGLTLLAFFLVAAAYGFAETSIADVNIPFSFIADGKTYPAGHYRFSTNEPETTIKIDGLKPANTNGVALVVTRLSVRTENAVNFVFDVAGNNHYLSEIHVPNQDGFYFKSATEKHTHIKVKGEKSKS
jgi:hypothetical protein